MAPTSNSAKALQQNQPRPAVPRAVVPAIPLPYIQKRQQQDAARAKAKEEAAAPTVVETPTPSSPASTTANITPVMVNGSSDGHKAENPGGSTGPTSPITPTTPATPAVEEQLEQTEIEEPEGSLAQDDSPLQAQETPKSVPSEGHSSASRSTYQMPPPFIPANHHQFNGMPSDSAKFPPPQAFNGQHPMHHAHPSAGSVMFGGYPDSNNSSPAPPQSAGNLQYPYPPPPQHGPAHHGPHQPNGANMQNMPNGFSPMGPPPPPGYYPRPDGFINPGAGNENFARRQMGSFGPPDGYSGAPSYDRSTPQSFHGSQSSVANEQENGRAFYDQYPTAVITNGSNGHIEDVRLYKQSQPRVASQQVANDLNGFAGPGRQAMQADHLDGLLQYIQSQFADPTFADYTLELRYSDDRAPPVRIPGHNLVFARSPTLKNLMTLQARDSNSDGLSVRTLLIESDDPFLRSDGFWMAVQRLYGGPLLDVGTAPAGAQSSVPLPGTVTDRFDLALGYAAAGHILEIGPVVERGIENASHLINWSTLEKALDFAVDGGLDSSWTLNAPNTHVRSPSTYGPFVNVLINSALNWVIANFPAGFELDTSVGEPIRNRRLPAVHDHRPSAPNPRLSMIKFGDHPTEESVKSTSANSTTTTLSKILLNLPFPLLKYVLESSRLGNVYGWATTVLRQKVMHTVIQEREKRRLKVQAAAYVSNAERKANSKEWDAVGWREGVLDLGGDEATPTLTRNWIDFTAPDL